MVKLKRLTISSIGMDLEFLDFSHTANRVLNDAILWENSLADPYKTKHTLIIVPGHATPRCLSKQKTYVKTKT